MSGVDTSSFAIVRVSHKIVGNCFESATNLQIVDASWMVMSVCQDARASSFRPLNSVEKSLAGNGKHLHPEVFAT